MFLGRSLRHLFSFITCSFKLLITMPKRNKVPVCITEYNPTRPFGRSNSIGFDCRCLVIFSPRRYITNRKSEKARIFFCLFCVLAECHRGWTFRRSHALCKSYFIVAIFLLGFSTTKCHFLYLIGNFLFDSLIHRTAGLL